MKKSLMWILILAIIAGAIGVFVTVRQNVGTATVSLSVPDTVRRGEPFEAEVVVTNSGDEPLRDTEIAVRLPDGLASLGFVNNRTRITEPVGDIGGGIAIKKRFKLLAVGKSDSKQDITVTATYRTSGGASEFDTSATEAVAIGAPAITLTVEAPEHTLPGSAIDVVLKYKNISTTSFDDVILSVKYPEAFSFTRASMLPDSLNSVWRLGELRAGSSGSITVTGKLDGFSEARFSFPATIAVNFLGREHVIEDVVASVSIAPSPLAVTVLVNGRGDYVARIGDELRYTIRYQNNSGIALTDVTARASIAGDIVSMESVRSDGMFTTQTSEVLWDASSTPVLRILDPGVSGELFLTVPLQATFPIRRSSDKNFTVKLVVRLESPSVPYYLSASKTSAAVAMTTKVAGSLSVDARGFHRDAAAALVNDGALPPQVGKATEYTVHWLLTNTATDMRSVQVSAALPSDVSWTGVVKSSGQTVPIYDAATRTVQWEIEKVPATRGVISDPLEAVFQVRATPASGDIGNFKELVGATSFTATDDFTGTTVMGSDSGITTALPDDKTVGQDGGRVIQ